MADEQTAEAGWQTDIVQRTATDNGDTGPDLIRHLARSLADSRYKDQAEAEKAAQQPAAAQPPQESEAKAEDTAQEETGPGETQTEDAAEQPPIDPPRSWTKEDKELWTGLPRATQERLAERERSREREFSTRLNEHATKSKSLTDKEAAAEQVRTEYEQGLTLLRGELQRMQAGEFGDIKTVADIEKLAREDWPRYVLWDAQQKKLAAIDQQIQAAEQRQAFEKKQKLSDFIKKEDALFIERAPELADAKKGAEVANSAISMLRDMGFTDNELGELWEGTKDISFRDHRIQLLIRDGVRFREAQANLKKAQAKPVPQVQRPGVARSANADGDERVKSLTQRLDQTGNWKDAAQLLVARRQAAR